MFTGIVTDIGKVVEVTGSAERRLRIRTGYEVDSVEEGKRLASTLLSEVETGI